MIRNTANVNLRYILGGSTEGIQIFAYDKVLSGYLRNTICHCQTYKLVPFLESLELFMTSKAIFITKK